MCEWGVGRRCAGGCTTTALILARHFFLVRVHTRKHERGGGVREGGREGGSKYCISRTKD
jgi:hypothetical protein